jgi:TM2 domain-containing membrane protein YozV
MRFRIKSVAALLAFALGALGVHRIYLGQRLWWLPLGVTLLVLPLLVGVRNWYQTPAFFVLVLPFVAGCIEALALALMSDAKFDARFNPGLQQTNRSGWDAVLVAIVTLVVGAIVLMTAIALFFQTIFER